MIRDLVVFFDGSFEKVEVVIFCIGYCFFYLFLKDDVIIIKDERIEFIYKYMVYIEYNNLIFVGIF